MSTAKSRHLEARTIASLVNPSPGLGGHGHVVVAASCSGGHRPAGMQLTDLGGVSMRWNSSDTDGEDNGDDEQAAHDRTVLVPASAPIGQQPVPERV